MNGFIHNGNTLSYSNINILNPVKYTEDISKKALIVISLADDVQEEIECLYEFVPEVDHHFVVLDKIGEGKCYCIQFLLINILPKFLNFWG